MPGTHSNYSVGIQAALNHTICVAGLFLQNLEIGFIVWRLTNRTCVPVIDVIQRVSQDHFSSFRCKPLVICQIEAACV